MARIPDLDDEQARILGLALDRIIANGFLSDAGIVNGFADEFSFEPDEAEAERFRREIERDARGNPDDW